MLLFDLSDPNNPVNHDKCEQLSELSSDSENDKLSKANKLH